MGKIYQSIELTQKLLRDTCTKVTGAVSPIEGEILDEVAKCVYVYESGDDADALDFLHSQLARMEDY
jgi:hypothetical protein